MWGIFHKVCIYQIIMMYVHFKFLIVLSVILQESWKKINTLSCEKNVQKKMREQKRQENKLQSWKLNDTVAEWSVGILLIFFHIISSFRGYSQASSLCFQFLAFLWLFSTFPDYLTLRDGDKTDS